MRRILIVWLVALTLVSAVACSGDERPATPGPEARIESSGFTVTAGGITATGPAQVAPLGTEVTLREVPAPHELAELELAGSPVVDIALADGVQPAAPVALSWTIPAGMDPESVAFITSDGPGKPWRGVPVKVTGDQAAVQIDHFSWGRFVDGAKLVGKMVDGINAYLGQTYSAPAGCTQKVQVNGVEVSLANSRSDYVHACVRAENGKVVVTAASNSPYVFPVRIQEFATMRVDGVPLALESLATGPVARLIYGDKYSGYLLAGGSVSAEYEIRDLAANREFVVIHGEIDAALGLVAVALAGAKMLVPAGQGLDEVLTKVELTECLAKVLQSGGMASAVEVAAILPVALNCVSAEVSALDLEHAQGFSIATAIVTSLAGSLTTQIRGIGDSIRGGTFDLTATTTVRPTPTPTPSPRQQAGWVPCANATWALEAKDRNGTVVFARCTDGLGLYEGGRKVSSWRARQSSAYGATAVSSDGSRMIIVADARTEEYLQVNATSGQGSVTRLATVTRRHTAGAR